MNTMRRENTDAYYDSAPVFKGELPNGEGEFSIYELDGTALLYWQDGVANYWEERFHSLPVAMLRLAVLFECAGSSRRRFFTQQHASFALDAVDFIHAQAKP